MFLSHSLDDKNIVSTNKIVSKTYSFHILNMIKDVI